jgi:hypothetical protein
MLKKRLAVGDLAVAPKDLGPSLAGRPNAAQPQSVLPLQIELQRGDGVVTKRGRLFARTCPERLRARDALWDRRMLLDKGRAS